MLNLTCDYCLTFDGLVRVGVLDEGLGDPLLGHLDVRLQHPHHLRSGRRRLLLKQSCIGIGSCRCKF